MIFPSFVAVAALFSLNVRAAEPAESLTDCRPSLWTEIQAIAKTAANGGSADFKRINDHVVKIRIGARAFRVELFESEFSDYGGNLNDVIATEIGGQCQLELTAVPAFGDMMEALGVNQPDWTIQDVVLAR